ncbi:MAG: hypothetical protein NZ850_04785 [Caldimicrobium sp.]|nr:hypothetical protein [Caldimicrobium sp.]
MRKACTGGPSRDRTSILVEPLGIREAFEAKLGPGFVAQAVKRKKHAVNNKKVANAHFFIV